MNCKNYTVFNPFDGIDIFYPIVWDTYGQIDYRDSKKTICEKLKLDCLNNAEQDLNSILYSYMIRHKDRFVILGSYEPDMTDYATANDYEIPWDKFDTLARAYALYLVATNQDKCTILDNNEIKRQNIFNTIKPFTL